MISVGVDEAGRGPLAGPVAVGIVAVLEEFDVAAEFPGVADSKALSEKKRDKLFEMLAARAGRAGAGDPVFTVEFGSATEIDERGIAVVIRELVARGVRALATYQGEALLGPARPRLDRIRILLDGALRAPEEYDQETVIGGDASVPLISLASIAAKVSRDRLMTALAEEYPHYGFDKHKGYGTRAHYAALAKHGLSPIHRRTFIRW